MLTEEEASKWPEFEAQIYKHFFEQHEMYERYHIHLVGVRGNGAIGDRKNRFGAKAMMDTTADPYFEVETDGDNTGSKPFFPIGFHRFATLKNTDLPIWDAKCLLIARKDTTAGIKFKMADENSKRQDEVLCEGVIDRADLPEAGTVELCQWKELVIPCKSDRMDGLEIVLRVKVSEGASRVNSKDAIEALFQETDARSYHAHVLEDATEQLCDNSVLQCWKQANATKAVIWVLG